MNSNPYKSPASASSQANATPWPKWMVRLLYSVFVICGLASLLIAIITSTTTFALTVPALGSLGAGAASLISAVLAIYGAVRNYRIEVTRIRESRNSQNEFYNQPHR